MGAMLETLSSCVNFLNRDIVRPAASLGSDSRQAAVRDPCRLAQIAANLSKGARHK